MFEVTQLGMGRAGVQEVSPQGSRLSCPGQKGRCGSVFFCPAGCLKGTDTEGVTLDEISIPERLMERAASPWSPGWILSVFPGCAVNPREPRAGRHTPRVCWAPETSSHEELRPPLLRVRTRLLVCGGHVRPLSVLQGRPVLLACLPLLVIASGVFFRGST